MALVWLTRASVIFRRGFADDDLEPPSQPVSPGCMRPQALDVELEPGQMIDPRTGVFARVGTSFLDSTRDFGINLGLRRIF
jgi:hypothetical protein